MLGRSKFERQDLERQLRKQKGKTNGVINGPAIDLGRAERNESFSPTFPKAARNDCDVIDSYAKNISRIKCANCRKKGHTSENCPRGER